MDAVILYRPNSDHERRVTEFAHDFQHQTQKAIKLLSLDTVDGAEMAKLYDITQYPAVLARRDDGALLKLWQGEQLPLINEVSAYADR